jgi:uncharacterized protein YbjQ (UPF0145 family)
MPFDPIDDIRKAIKEGKSDKDILKMFPAIKSTDRLELIKEFDYGVNAGEFEPEEAVDLYPEIKDILVTPKPGVPTTFSGGKDADKYDIPKQKIKVPQLNTSESTSNINSQAQLADLQETKELKTVEQIYQEKKDNAINKTTQRLSESDDVYRKILFDEKIKKEQYKGDNLLKSDNTEVGDQEAFAKLYSVFEANPGAFVPQESVEAYKQKALTDPKVARVVLGKIASEADEATRKEIKRDIYLAEADQRVQQDPSRLNGVLSNADGIDKGELDYPLYTGQLVDPTNFFESFVNGFKARQRDLSDYKKLVTLPKDKAIEELEKEANSYNPDVPQEMPLGELNQLGQMTGMESIPMLKGAGAATLTGMTTGNPYAAAGAATLAVGEEYYNRSYASGFKSAYFELRNNGIPAEEAYDVAKRQAKIDGIWGAIEAGASAFLGVKGAGKFLSPTGKVFTKNFAQTAKNFLKDAGKFVKETSPEALTDAGVAGVSQIAKNISAQDNGLDRDLFDEVGENIKGELMFAGGMGILTHTGRRLVSPKVYREALHNISLNKDEDIKEFLSQMVEDGQIQEKEATSIAQGVTKYREIVSQIPDDIDEEKKIDLVPKILKREELQEQFDKANKAFKPAIKDKIDAIDNEIQEASDYIPESKKQVVNKLEVAKIEKEDTSNPIDFSQMSDSDIENRMTKLEGMGFLFPSKEYTEFDEMEKEMERRERSYVFNVPISAASEAIDTLLKKDREQPNGYGSFITRRDASETKGIIERYLSPELLSDEEIKSDFKEAITGRPKNWYADGMKLRESMRLAADRGINMTELVNQIKEEFINDGYSESKANEMVAYYLSPIFQGAKSENITPNNSTGQLNGEQTPEPLTSATQETISREQPFTTKSGKYSIDYQDGKRIVKDNQGNIVENKNALKQHEENYNYNFGERVKQEDFPQEINDPIEADRWVAENTQSPIEAAEVFFRNEKQELPLNDKEYLIKEFGGFQTNEKSYNRFGDQNNMNNAKARAYIRKDAQSLDQIAQEISDHTGKEITPQDLVDYMDKFPNGTEVSKKVENEARATAAQKFEELTGIPLNDRTAALAIKQANPQETQQATEEFEQDIFNLPIEQFNQWVNEEKSNLDYDITGENTTNAGTPESNSAPDTGAAADNNNQYPGQADSNEDNETEEEQIARLRRELGIPEDLEEAPFKKANKPGALPNDYVTFEELGITESDNIETVLDKLISYGGPFSDMLSIIRELPDIKKLDFRVYIPGTDKSMDTRVGMQYLKAGGRFDWAGLYFPQSQFGSKALLLNPDVSTNPYYDFTHEILHFLTLDSSVSGHFESFISKDKLNTLKKVFEYIKSKKPIPEGSSYDPKTYGLVNFNEFMAEVLINPEFREYLSDVFATEQDFQGRKLGTIESFLNTVIEAIKEFFAKLFGKVIERGNLDFSKPLVDNAVDLMNDMFFTRRTMRAGKGFAVEGALAIKARIIPQTQIGDGTEPQTPQGNPLNGKTIRDMMKLAKAASMNGMTDEQIESAIKSVFPNLSDDIIKNIVQRAKLENTYKPLPQSNKPGLLPDATVPDFPAPKEKKTITHVKDFFKNKVFSSTNGLADWIRTIKDYADGNIQAEVRKLKRAIDQYNAAVKKAGFKDKAKFDEALRSLKATSDIPNALPSSALSQLPKELQAVAIKMRGHIDSLGKILIVEGLVTPEQAITIETNMGEYMHRAYKLFSQKDWAKKIDPKVRKEAGRYLFHQALTNILNSPQSQGMTQQDMERQAAVMAMNEIEAILSSANDPLGFKSQSSGGMNLGVLQQRKDIPEPIRKLLGEYTDPAVTYAITIGKMASLISQAKYLKGLREQGMGSLFFEKHDLNRPAEYSVPVAAEGSETWSPLNGLYTTPEIKEALKISEPEKNELIKGWMQFVGAIRWGKTVGSIVTQFKNFESNLGFSVMNGHADITNFKEALQYLNNSNNSDQLVDKLTRLGVVGQSVNLMEIKTMLKNDTINRVIKDASGETHWFDGLRKIYDTLNKIYGVSDNFWKVYGFLNEANGLSKALYGKSYENLSPEELADIDNQAAERTKNVMPTYSRVWQGFKYISQHAPIFGNFLSFQAESMRTLTNSFGYAVRDMKDPKLRTLGAKRMAGIITYFSARGAILYYITQVTGVGMAGLYKWMSDDDEDQKMKDLNRYVPSFMRSGDKLVFDEGNGELTVYDVSSLDPFGTLFKTFNALTDGGEQNEEGGLMSAFREFAQAYIGLEMTFETIKELETNTDKRGDPIYNPAQTEGEKFEAGVAYMWKQLKPSTIDFLVRAYTRENKMNEWGAIAGARGHKVKIPSAFSAKLSDMSEWFDITNDQFGKIFYSIKSTDEDKRTAAKEADEMSRRIIQRLHKDYKAALNYGVPMEELDERIGKKQYYDGYNKKVKEAIKTGDVSEINYYSERVGKSEITLK